MRIRPLLAVVLALCLAFFTTACSGDSEAVQRGASNVTDDDIHNTGKANDCPTIGDSARGSIALSVGGSYELRDVCMHPVQVYACLLYTSDAADDRSRGLGDVYKRQAPRLASPPVVRSL